MGMNHDDSYETVKPEGKNFCQAELLAQSQTELGVSTGDKAIAYPMLLNDENVSVHPGEDAQTGRVTRKTIMRVITGTAIGLLLGLLLQFSIDFFTWRSDWGSSDTSSWYHQTAFENLCCSDTRGFKIYDGYIKRKFNHRQILISEFRVKVSEALLLFWIRERDTTIFQKTILVAFLGAATTYAVNKRKSRLSIARKNETLFLSAAW